MPKLNKTTAQKVEDTEAQSFAPIEPGFVIGRLMEVEVKQGKEHPYWSWSFVVPEDCENAGKRFWANTSLSPAAAFKMKEAFTAFGVPTDTDTDTLCGQLINLRIGVRTIQAGEKAGQTANTVEEMLPYTEAEDEGADEEPF